MIYKWGYLQKGFGWGQNSRVDFFPDYNFWEELFDERRNSQTCIGLRTGTYGIGEEVSDKKISSIEKSAEKEYSSSAS